MPSEFGPNVLPFPSAGGVPSSVTRSGPDIDSIIGHISDPLTPELIQKATTPIPGAHVPQMPSAFTREVSPYQMQPMDRTPVVGAGNARARGISNAFTGVTNALGAVMTAEAQKKQGQIRDAASKVITAQQAIDEAQQMHDMALQNGDAATASKMMDLIKENQKVRDGVFSDPKMRKALAKGFNISYTNPSSNKTEEHQAVMQALQGAKTREEKKAAIAKLRQEQNEKAGAAAGTAFAASQPRGLAPNLAAQQKLQIAEMEQKAQVEAMKNYLTFKAGVIRAGATVDAAKVRTMGQLMLQQSRMQQQQDLQNRRFAQAEKLLGQRFNDSLKLISTRAAQARELSHQIFADKEADPLNQYTKARAAAEKYQNNAVLDGNTLVQLMTQRQKMYPSGAGGSEASKDPDGYQAINAQINLAQQALEADKANTQNMSGIANNLQQIYGLTGGPAGSTGTGSEDLQPDAVGGSDYTDPLNYLNNSGTGEQP